MSIDLNKERILCRLEDIPDGKSKGFLPQRREDQIFAVRHGTQVFIYLNSCPHNWRPLDFARDRFLGGDDRDIVCYAHGAHFDIPNGHCTYGPCLNEELIKVPFRIEDGAIIIPLELPRIPRESQPVS